jgi:hypothetical protein
MNSLSFRSFLTIAIGASLLSLAACKEYLDVKPLSVYSTAETFANVTNATSAVLGVYSLLETMATARAWPPVSLLTPMT